jgi:hypothetical protein
MDFRTLEESKREIQYTSYSIGWIEDSYLRNGPEISWDDGSSSVCKTCPSKEDPCTLLQQEESKAMGKSADCNWKARGITGYMEWNWFPGVRLKPPILYNENKGL